MKTRAMRRGGPAAVLILILALVSCAPSAGRSAAVRVVAAFYPLAEAAQRIGGSGAAVSDLTPAGAEPHDLEIRPSDLAAIRGADLIVYLHGFQPALDEAISSLRLRSRALDLLSAVPSRPGDPHFWLDPQLFGQAVLRIEVAMSARAPSHRPDFARNAQRLIAALNSLDAEYRRSLTGCARKQIFTSHAAFGYLARRYGLEQIGITGVTPESEPSTARLQEVARLARATHPTTIFAETLVSDRTAKSVARVVGARVEVLNPIEGLTRQQRARGYDYISLMRANLRILIGALGCRPIG